MLYVCQKSTSNKHHNLLKYLVDTVDFLFSLMLSCSYLMLKVSLILLNETKTDRKIQSNMNYTNNSR